MVRKRAFLKYLGNRKWRRIKKPTASLGRSFLVYIGNRKWKRKGSLNIESERAEPR